MTTIKSFTDLEQSRKLAEILPIESADYFHTPDACIVVTEPYKLNEGDETVITAYKGAIPCWSLSALLSVLPKGTDIIKEEADTENEKYMYTVGVKDDIISTFGNNPIDACYEMIIKLHKQELL